MIDLTLIQWRIMEALRRPGERRGMTVGQLADALDEPEYRIRAEVHELYLSGLVDHGQRDWSLTDQGDLIAWQTRLDV